ncbi:hypothetical protein [Enterobacter sp. CCUG 70166]|uniref:hypothetical protein n=1 Tax=Enterobacter sp. CCUG 70166 TaxID=2028297 RepID=UPI001CDCA0CD|nr:hypothetical protein [Enterobacter sp. CCUG 70166]
MTSKREKGVSVMLDGEIVVALQQLQNNVIQKMNQGGVFGMAATPTLGYLARQLLRNRLGLPDDKTDRATVG